MKRASIDVSGLPTQVYGYRSVVWWGTAAFMLIEGTTLVICAMTYLYLGRHFDSLPPERIQLPALGAATANVALMLASLVPNHFLSKAASRKDLGGVKVLTLLAIALSLGMAVLRWFELQAAHVRWDQNAYGSAVWATLIFHGTLLAVEVGEVAVMSAIFWMGRNEEKHWGDVTDLCFYWWFMVLSWLPLYGLLYGYPRWT